MLRVPIAFALTSLIAGSVAAHAAEPPVVEERDSPPLICGCPTGLKSGDISVTTNYQHIVTTKHLFSDGEALNRGDVHSDIFILSLDYAVTDRLVMSAGVPYVFSKYIGRSPHVLPLDDGTRHSSAQDYRVDLRYNFALRKLVVTPIVGFAAPTHEYAYFGHAAPGSALHEQFAAINVERNLDELFPGLFAQGRYEYTRVQKVLDISHDRSNLDLNLGYFVLPRLSVRTGLLLQKTHGGIDLVNGQTLPPVLFLHHDQLVRTDFVGASAGGSYSVSDSVDLFVGVLRTLRGRNMHKIDYAPNIGMTWTLPAARWRHKDAPSCPIGSAN